MFIAMSNSFFTMKLLLTIFPFPADAKMPVYVVGFGINDAGEIQLGSRRNATDHNRDLDVVG